MNISGRDYIFLYGGRTDRILALNDAYLLDIERLSWSKVNALILVGCSCLIVMLSDIFLVPYGLAGGTLSLLAVCQSVCPSVRHTLVFRTFLCRLLRYWLDTWYMNLSWHNTDKVWVLSCLTYFYRSYCPLLKFSFPDFSLLTCILSAPAL